MKYLTFLEYTTLDNTGKNIELKLSQKDNEIESLKHEIITMHENQAHYSEEHELLRREMAEFKKEFGIKQLGIE